MIKIGFGLLMLMLSSPIFALGGDFTLTDQHGDPYRLSEHHDKVIALFFGYTHCPDICPDTLATIGSALNLLDDSRGVQVVFVSVDPSRDTPDYLKTYLAYFDQNYVGLSGSWSELKHVADQWNARFSTPRTPATDRYFVDHSSGIYVIERGGKVHSVVPYGMPARHLANVLQGALAVPPALSQPIPGLRRLSGEWVDIDAAKTSTILHFWASWCGPCRKEFADLEAARDQVLALPAQVYAVNLGDRRQGIEGFLQDYPLSYPMLSDRRGYSEQRWAVKTLPQTLVLDAEGLIKARFEGVQPWAEPSFVEELRALVLDQR